MKSSLQDSESVWQILSLSTCYCVAVAFSQNNFDDVILVIIPRCACTSEVYGILWFVGLSV